MSLASKSSTAQNQSRLWRTPTSRARWLWLAISAALYIVCLLWYLYAIRTQQFVGPFNDPLRLFGIIAFLLVLVTAAYSLRRRFARGLPGKAQDWLWMHTWLGIAAILIAMLHENFVRLTHNYCANLSCLTTADWGSAALFALIFLVLSGVVGRLLDTWQAHVIAHEASSNGVGIARALEERILELEYTVERLCAGKSAPFKAYCMQTLEGTSKSEPPDSSQLAASEHGDFQRASNTLATRAQLVQSLHRQQRARTIIHIWRSIHIVLALLSLLVILYHGVLELLSSVFHVIS